MVSQGMPYMRRPGDGQRSWLFDTGKVLGWLMREEFAEKDKASRSRLLEAKAGLKFLEYLKRLGLVTDKREIIDRITAGDAIIVSRLKAMPQRLASYRCTGVRSEVVTKLIDKELDGVLDQLDKPWNER